MSTTIWPTIADAISHARHTAVAPLRWDPVDHLLSRFTFGPTAAARTALAKSGPDAWYDNEVGKAAKYQGYAGNSNVAAVGPLLAMSPYDVRQWLKAHDNEYGWDAMDQLTQVTLGLQGWSVAQPRTHVRAARSVHHTLSGAPADVS